MRDATAKDSGRWAIRDWPYLVSMISLLALIVLAFMVGQFPVRPWELVAAVMARTTGGDTGISAAAETVIFQIRGPRIIAAIVVGAALAAAGTAYQGMFRNPLVSPDILGVSSGAALGAVIAIFLSLHVAAIQGCAFLGGLAAVAVVYTVGSIVRGHDPLLTLILAGVVIGTLFGSCIALLKYLADPYNQLPAITFWLLGSLAGVAPQDLLLVIPLTTLGLVPMALLRWRMNLLSLPDDEARSLGVNTRQLRTIVVCAATLMTAASVAISGIIGWVGLLVPHAARLLIGPDFSRLLPLSMAFGACYLLAVDTLARTLVAVEIPPGVLTALIGTPFFLWLLAATRRGWA
jgi:iron complex transport system permease protein